MDGLNVTTDTNYLEVNYNNYINHVLNRYIQLMNS